MSHREPFEIVEELITFSHRLTRTASSAVSGSLSPSGWRVLSTLRTEGPLRIGELADVIRVRQPGMTKMLHGMVADALVERLGDAADSRAVRIGITDAGIDRLDTYRRRLADFVTPQFADLDDEDWQILDRATELLARAATASDSPASRTNPSRSKR